MSWKGVQGGNPEGEERMRGSALSSPMGVPLGYFRGYKKNEEDEKRGMFEGCSHGFSVFFCLSSVNYLLCWGKTKGANQGQGGVFELRSHVSP